jgi:two-component system sensor histidine kinase BaeS
VAWQSISEWSDARTLRQGHRSRNADLSAVSRAEERRLTLRPVLVSAQKLVSGTVAATRPRFEAKGISLTAESVTAGNVPVDPDRLAEALGALLDNALRHTGSGGVSRSPPPDITTDAGSW